MPDDHDTTRTTPTSITLTPGERAVLIALCRLIVESPTATPATNRQIADEVFLGGGVIDAHLRRLADLFGCSTRAQLAAAVLASGIIAPDEFAEQLRRVRAYRASLGLR
jgi:DNA-binding CsgD family transcriptional regulator